MFTGSGVVDVEIQLKVEYPAPTRFLIMIDIELHHSTEPYSMMPQHQRTSFCHKAISELLQHCAICNHDAIKITLCSSLRAKKKNPQFYIDVITQVYGMLYSI